MTHWDVASRFSLSPQNERKPLAVGPGDRSTMERMKRFDKALASVILAASAAIFAAAPAGAGDQRACSESCDRKASDCLDACETKFKDDKPRVECKMQCSVDRQKCETASANPCAPTP